MSKAIDHGARAHAILSASGSHRWLNCTPSARLEEAEPESKGTVFTQEGTFAHELGEISAATLTPSYDQVRAALPKLGRVKSRRSIRPTRPNSPSRPWSLTLRNM